MCVYLCVLMDFLSILQGRKNKGKGTRRQTEGSKKKTEIIEGRDTTAMVTFKVCAMFLTENNTVYIFRECTFIALLGGREVNNWSSKWLHLRV